MNQVWYAALLVRWQSHMPMPRLPHAEETARCRNASKTLQVPFKKLFTQSCELGSDCESEETVAYPGPPQPGKPTQHGSPSTRHLTEQKLSATTHLEHQVAWRTQHSATAAKQLDRSECVQAPGFVPRLGDCHQPNLMTTHPSDLRSQKWIPHATFATRTARCVCGSGRETDAGALPQFVPQPPPPPTNTACSDLSSANFGPYCGCVHKSTRCRAPRCPEAKQGTGNWRTCYQLHSGWRPSEL